MALTFGTYPHPGFSDRLITNKPEGSGWNNLGKRKPYAIVLHRMIGSLWGTDAFFRDPNVGALTDYGIGVEAMDGKSHAGEILRWCDPEGTITPWASGPVSSPYGDGLCFINKFGDVNAANKNCVSIEISGKQDTPVDDVAFRELVKFCAYWCDHMQVPFDSLTNSPHTGCSAFIWHEEFTFGTGKKCPFDVVKGLTAKLIDSVSAELKPYQTKTGGTPTVTYPPGFDAAICKGIWGNAYKSYQFDENGTISKIWLNEGVLSPLSFHFKDSNDGREIFAFASGQQIGRLNKDESFRVMEAA